MCCWENEVGEEVFKVILVDLGIIIAVGSLVHLSRAVLKKLCFPSVRYSLLYMYSESFSVLGFRYRPIFVTVLTNM